MREHYGVVISDSLRQLEGKVIRIGHMGHMAQPAFVQMALSALGCGLRDLNYPVALDAGLGAALSAM
jgi:aspartate aminotransferase-like enzyme